ncbi:hypothetical protein LTR09_000424 [Extremus antarcticus]|uniref:Uncharacterized protein n=1 Tax=Extremus antarcticus TaxID=702011 RepID=A0AAJ0LXI1_9PEZI|nr:hypothetical protein LTR09_000424 [Extremus antarcticus]
MSARRSHMRSTADNKPKYSSPLARYVWHIDDPPSPSSPTVPIFLRSPAQLARPRPKIKLPPRKQPELQRQDAGLAPALFGCDGEGKDFEGGVAESIERPVAEVAEDGDRIADDFGNGTTRAPLQEGVEAALKGTCGPDGKAGESEANKTLQDAGCPNCSAAATNLRLVVSDEETHQPHNNAEQYPLDGQEPLPETHTNCAQTAWNRVDEPPVLASPAEAPRPVPDPPSPHSEAHEETSEADLEDGTTITSRRAYDLGAAAGSGSRVILHAHSPRPKSRPRLRIITQWSTEEEDFDQDDSGEGHASPSGARIAADDLRAESSEGNVSGG